MRRRIPKPAAGAAGSPRRRETDAAEGQGAPPAPPEQDIQRLVLQALGDLGGVGYLRRQGEENPRAFLTLMGKVLPLQLAARPEEPVKVEIVRISEEEAGLGDP